MMATSGAQWIRTRDRATGRQLAVAVPSQSRPGLYHLVSLGSCDCRGFAYRGTCSHLRAVRAEVGIQNGGKAHLQVLRASGAWLS